MAKMQKLKARQKKTNSQKPEPALKLSKNND